MLTALSSHYWRPDFSPSQAAAMWLDYCADLAICRLDEIEVAIRDYRLNSKEKFFPKSAQLRDIVFANRKHREEMAKLVPIRFQFGDSRPLMWWCKMPYLWQPHWQESEIPAAHHEGWRRRLEAMRAKGEFGWAVADFAGLARKQADKTDQPKGI